MLLDLGLPGRTVWMFVPLAMLAGMFSYYETFHETEALQDDLLRQAALYVAPDSKPETLPEGDGDTRILVQMPQQEDPVVSLPAHLADGLHTLQADGDDDYYRVYIRTTERGADCRDAGKRIPGRFGGGCGTAKRVAPAGGTAADDTADRVDYAQSHAPRPQIVAKSRTTPNQ